MNNAPEPPGLDSLLDYLRRERGLDFGGYKRSTLARRIAHRVQAVRAVDLEDYQVFLEAHPEETVTLLNTVLINVTAFFRDERAWQFLAKEIVPQIAQEGGAGKPIRAWSAGCASGEEAYSLAMLLCEAMGRDEFRRRVRIYATDVDQDALREARLARYTAEALKAVPEELRDRYFDRVGDGWVFQPDLRRSVIFGRHDLAPDAPISRLDLIVCRNTLMYFNAPAQAQILARLHFALLDGGYLFLGRAEMLLSRADLFVPLHMSHRIFAKVPSSGPHLRVLPGGQVPYLEVRTTPLADNGGGPTGVSIAFADVTAPHDLQTQLECSKREVERAYEELQLTNEALQTTNEELESTIEELETTNEELQATNEELETINVEAGQRMDEADRATGFLQDVLRSIPLGAVALDSDLNITLWNDRAEEWWGLRADEVVGKSLLGLDIGLPVERLRGVIELCREGGIEEAGAIVLRAHDRRGRPLACRVTCTPLRDMPPGEEGVILLMEEISDAKGREQAGPPG